MSAIPYKCKQWCGGRVGAPYVCGAPAKVVLKDSKGLTYMCGVHARAHDRREKFTTKTFKLVPYKKLLPEFDAARKAAENQWWALNHLPVISPLSPRHTNACEVMDLQNLRAHLKTWSEAWWYARGYKVNCIEVHDGLGIALVPA